MSLPEDRDYPPLDDDALAGVADQSFQEYDAREAAGGSVSSVLSDRTGTKDALMNVMIQPTIEQVPGLRANIDQATQFLAEEVGDSAPLIKVVWDTSRDSQNRLLVDLSLRDWTSELATRFAPEELANAGQVRERLHRLWGELLRQSSRTQYQKLVQRLQEERGD